MCTRHSPLYLTADYDIFSCSLLVVLKYLSRQHIHVVSLKHHFKILLKFWSESLRTLKKSLSLVIVISSARMKVVHTNKDTDRERWFVLEHCQRFSRFHLHDHNHLHITGYTYGTSWRFNPLKTGVFCDKDHIVIYPWPINYSQ